MDAPEIHRLPVTVTLLINEPRPQPWDSELLPVIAKLEPSTTVIGAMISVRSEKASDAEHTTCARVGSSGRPAGLNLALKPCAPRRSFRLITEARDRERSRLCGAARALDSHHDGFAGDDEQASGPVAAPWESGGTGEVAVVSFGLGSGRGLGCSLCACLSTG